MSKKIFKHSVNYKDAKKGKMFILVDDESRENEGDLVIPGSKCNSRLLICGKTWQGFDLSGTNKKTN